jgi:amino acid adenylation domain-containing protein
VDLVKNSEKVDRESIQDITALTYLQEGILFHYLKNPGSNHYFEQLSLNISGEIDAALLEKALNFVVETNEMLRTLFRWENMKNPVQIVLKKHLIKPKHYDFSHIDSSEKNKRIEEIKIKDRKEQFDLRKIPFRIALCKIQEDRYEIIVSNHHILFDGWSTGIILEELFKAYDDLAKGREFIKPVKTKFKDFIKWIGDHAPDEREKFWRDYLKGIDTRTELPVKKAKITGNSRVEKETGSYRFNLPHTMDKKFPLETFIKNHKVTIASLFYCAWGILLQKYANSDDVLFGTTVSGRSANIKRIENVVGLFINTLPLRMARKPNETVSGLLRRINHTLQARSGYEATSITDIKDYIRWGHKEELFDSILVIENYPLDIRQLQEGSSLKINSYSIEEAVPYDLTVSIRLHESQDIEIIFLYHKDVYGKDTIEQLSLHFTRILRGILSEPGKGPHQIKILSNEEKQQILVDFNNTATDYPKNKTVHRVFKEQAAKTPDYIALEVKEQEEEFIASVSYRALNKKASQLARVLRAKGVAPGGIVGIMIHRSIEMVCGILAILKNGSAYLPIAPDYPGERIRCMLRDSGSKFLLIKGTYNLNITKGPIVIDIGDDGICSEYTAGVLPVGRPDAPLYVMYTSGTTGLPKGVAVDHINAMRLVKNTGCIDFHPRDKLLQTGDIAFDASTFEIWGTLLNGACMVLVGKETILNFIKLKEVIKKHKVSIMWMTSPLFNQVSDIELFAGLKKLLVGGDRLSPPHINRVRKTFPRLKIINGYGPTENTTFSTTYLIPNKENRENEGRIPIGSPIANSTAYIVDKYNQLLPIGIPGELIVGGDGIASGYLNNPQLTCDRFIENPYANVKTPNSREKRLYKTGDLARWLGDGNIDFLGRADHQVKIKGFRVELGEIENQLTGHKDIKEAIVISRSDKTKESYLCAYVVPLSVFPDSASLQVSQIRAYLSKKLPAYMIPAYFVILDRLPLTSNGKLDSKALPMPGIIPGKQYRPPRNEREEKLVKIWSEVLGTGEKKIGIDENFFDLGGHSLKATRLISRIHQIFDMEMPLGQLFQSPTIRELSGFLGHGKKSRPLTVKPGEKKEYYPLSSAQERLFAIQQLDTVGTTYNISLFAVLEGNLDRGRLEIAFMRMLNRHESLRTGIEIIAGHPRQKVHDKVIFNIEYDETGSSKTGKPGAQGITNNFFRPFDLSRPPLLRVGIIKKEDKTHILMVDMHHIVSDGISVQLLMAQFRAFYSGEELPALNIQYRDYCQWRQGEKELEKIKKQAAYWREQFADEIPVLDLPADFNRPMVQRFEGSRLSFKIDARDTGGLKKIAKQENVTLFTILLSVVNIFLSKLTGQADIVTGTPTAGRKHMELESIIGMFVNTLPLRNKLPGAGTFRGFLRKVAQNTLAAFENQDYPFEELVEQLKVRRDVGRNPLFDVMFLLQDIDISATEIEATIPGQTRGLSLEPFDYETGTSKFDLTVESFEVEETLSLSFEYSTNLFKPSTIERYQQYFKKIISGIAANSEIKLQDIEIIPEREKQEILFGINNTAADYPQDKAVHQLFAAQAERTPDHIALIGLPSRPQKVKKESPGYKKHYLTYKELNEKSHRLAHLLRRKGVHPDTIAAIMVDRSIEMIVGIYAILKAGGAYMPIDPDYPGERKQYLLADSSVKVLVTTGISAEKIEGFFPSGHINIILIDNLETEKVKEDFHPAPVLASGLAYVIYTSGSTGKPKGVMIEHGSLVNRLNWMQRAYPLGEEDVILQKTTVVFDVSVWELFWWSIHGASLCLLSPGDEKNPGAIINAIAQNKVTTMHFVPSMLTVFLDYPQGDRGDNLQIKAHPRMERFTAQLATLKQVFSSGEALGSHQTVRFNKLLNGKNKTRLINLYGPTEATIDVSYFNCPREGETIREGSIPIGKPIDNIRLYVVHQQIGLQPAGIPGELCIAGHGLGRGYLNKPGLTAEKFIEAPFLRGERIYKTGDLVKWKSDGNIEFLGRSDYQVKLRGFRIELGEIENQLLCCPGVKEAVVDSKNDNRGDNYLCAYLVPHAPASLEIPRLRQYLQERLPDYMVPAHFIELAEMPLTNTGKINRNSLPEPETVSTRDYTPPRDAAEEAMRDIWSEILGINKEKISIDDNFFELGGHSLKVIRLVSRVHEIFNIEIVMGQLFETPTIRTLSQHLRQGEKTRRQVIEPAEKKEYFLLSSAQKRLYILQQLDRQGIAYNMPLVVKPGGNLDRDKLGEVFEKLIARHESLRTSFELLHREPVQNVHDEVDFEIEYLDAGRKARGAGRKAQSKELEEERRAPCAVRFASTIKNFIRPFDLSCAPLLRVGLIGIEAQTHILVVDMHHIVSDGKSLGIVFDEFMALYSGTGTARTQAAIQRLLVVARERV